MTHIDVRKVFHEIVLLAAGRGATSSELQLLEGLWAGGSGEADIVGLVNDYMSAAAADVGTVALLQRLALNGLGMALTNADAHPYAELIANGQMSWADVFVSCINLTDAYGRTLDNRAAAGHEFLSLLESEGKEKLFSGRFLDSAVSNLIASVDYTAETLNTAKSRLLILSTNLDESGLSAHVADGYIKQATVFIDENGDGQLSPGEWSTKSDDAGRFLLPADAPTGMVVAFGGEDILTGKQFQGSLAAPAGTSIVNPVTTLIQAYMSNAAAGSMSSGSASKAVAKALGVGASIDLLTYDPLAVLADSTASPDVQTQAFAVQKKLVQLANIVIQLSNSLVAVDATLSRELASQHILKTMSDLVSRQGVELDLVNADTLRTIVDNSSAAVASGLGESSAQIAAIMSASNDRVANAGELGELARATVVAQDGVVNALVEAIGSSRNGKDLSDVVAAYTGAQLASKIESAVAGEIAPGVGAPQTGTGGSAPGGATGGSDDGGSNTPTPTSASLWLNEQGGTSSSPVVVSAATRELTLKIDPRFAGHAEVIGFDADDAVQLNASAGPLLAVSSSAGNVSLVTNLNGVITEVTLVNVLQADDLVHDLASFNALPIGDISLTGDMYATATLDLDKLGGSVTSPTSIDASIGGYKFFDDTEHANVTRITGFGADDTLQLSFGASPSLSSQGGDVVVTNNSDGVLSTITLVGVAPSAQIIFDIPSFNALTVGDIIF